LRSASTWGCRGRGGERRSGRWRRRGRGGLGGSVGWQRRYGVDVELKLAPVVPVLAVHHDRHRLPCIQPHRELGAGNPHCIVVASQFPAAAIAVPHVQYRVEVARTLRANADLINARRRRGPPKRAVRPRPTPARATQLVGGANRAPRYRNRHGTPEVRLRAGAVSGPRRKVSRVRPYPSAHARNCADAGCFLICGSAGRIHRYHRRPGATRVRLPRPARPPEAASRISLSSNPLVCWLLPPRNRRPDRAPDASTLQHPFNARFTAWMISSMVMSPSPLVSPTEHSETGLVPRAMFTMVTADQSHRTPRFVTSKPAQPNRPTRGVCARSLHPGIAIPTTPASFRKIAVRPLAGPVATRRRPSNRRCTLFAVDGIRLWSLLQTGKSGSRSGQGKPCGGSCGRQSAAAVFVRLTPGFNARTW